MLTFSSYILMFDNTIQRLHMNLVHTKHVPSSKFGRVYKLSDRGPLSCSGGGEDGDGNGTGNGNSSSNGDIADGMNATY